MLFFKITIFTYDREITVLHTFEEKPLSYCRRGLLKAWVYRTIYAPIPASWSVFSFFFTGNLANSSQRTTPMSSALSSPFGSMNSINVQSFSSKQATGFGGMGGSRVSSKFWLVLSKLFCITYEKNYATVKLVLAVTCIKRSFFSCPVIENFI